MDRRSFIRVTAALAGTSLLPRFINSASAKTTLKFDSYISETAGPSWVDEWFLKQLEERTNGDVVIRRYWAGSLNKVGEHLAAVRDKTSEMSLISPGYYQVELPVTRGLEWYYRMDHADSLQLVCRDVYKQFEPLRDEWEKRHRSKVLYWTNWNYAPLVMRDSIKSIDEIKGKRIRGYGIATDVIEKLGGIAVPMAAPDVYQALERGVLDGVYGFDFVTAVAYKLHEVAPNFYDIGDGPHAPATTVMNIDVWNNLSPDIQKVATEIADEIYGGKFTEIYDQVLEDYVKKLLSEGGTISTFSDEEKARAKALVQPAEVDAWIETVAKPAGIDGEAMQKLVDEAIKKYDPHGKMLRPYQIAQSLK